MDTYTFKNKADFAKYVETQALKVLKEEEAKDKIKS